MSRSFKGGILLILAAVFLLLNQVGLIPGPAFMFLLSFAFISAYVLLGARKEYGNIGFLIPGMVLLSITTFSTVAEQPGIESLSPAFFFLGLSLSFWVIFLVHTFWFKTLEHGARFWPAYPGTALLLIAGIISFAGERSEYLNMLNYLWIFALMAVGVWLVVSSIKKAKS